MVSKNTREVIKATVPVLEQYGRAIARVFYDTILAENEVLRNVFNNIHQVTGRQPDALATMILAAAKHIDDLYTLSPYVFMVAQKHRALQVKPEHYPIVGRYLLRAIKEVLGDLATPGILKAWKEAYGVIADIFIKVEMELYEKASWSGWKPFRVVNREHVAENIVQFTVQPDPESGVELSNLSPRAGQYISINVHPTIQNNKYDALRHYSIRSESMDEGLKFIVNLETSRENENGLVSGFLHHFLSIGDEIMMSAPAGEFGLDRELMRQDDIPLILLCSGVGCAPLIAMLESQLKINPERPIYWIQTCRSEAHLPFGKELELLSEEYSSLRKYIVLTDIHPRIDENFLRQILPHAVDLYLCGSPSFMSSMLDHLESLGLDYIHVYVY